MQNNRLIKLQEMLAESPSDIFLNYALAMEYKGLSQFNKTIEQLNKVLLLDENHVATLYQLGVLWSERNENDQAILFLEKGFLIAKQKKDLKTANEFNALIDEILY
jgi:tetratricopeptide (TPR) repeat protein